MLLTSKLTVALEVSSPSEIVYVNVLKPVSPIAA